MTLRTQNHHIIYEDSEGLKGELVVSLPWFMHRPLNICQRWKYKEKDPEWLQIRYVYLQNWLLAINYELIRVAKELYDNE